MKRKIYLLLIIVLFINIAGCGNKNNTNNDINNKVYDVEINIDNIMEAFIPATEKASESVLGITVYSRVSLLNNWSVSSIGSCVVYETTVVLKDGSKIDYNSFRNNVDDFEVDYFTYKAITNAHVVNNNKMFNKKVVYDGENNINTEFNVLGKDDDIDLAVISFKSSILYAPMTFSENNSVKKGQFVIAVGNPVGYEYYSTVTLGIVSYVNRYLYDEGYSFEYIQHDAAINPGSSGGALVDVSGNLIGINTSKVIEDGIDEIGFAIPIHVIKEVLPRLESGKKIEKVKSGLTGKDINELKLEDILNDNETSSNIKELSYGFYVDSVSKNSIFYNVLYQGDIVLEVNDNKIFNVSLLDNSLIYLEKNDIITLKIIRNNNIETIDVKY